MKLHTDYSLQNLNTLAINAVANNYVAAETLEDVHKTIDYANEQKLELKVLGGGSNVVMADTVSGLVLKYVANTIQVLSESEDSVRLKVDAGYEWHPFVLHCLNNGWFGLENLSYIPGTVGASPVQNIGAYGVEVKDLIESVNGVYLESGLEFSLTAQECEFAYRESLFKQALNGKTLITSVVFELSKKPDVKISYSPLNKMAEEQGVPSPMQLSEWVVDVRKSKLPEPSELPNAGSFFKNPVVAQEQFKEILSQYPDIPNYPQENAVKLPAGWLIDQLGLKGKSFGPVSVHKKQALVLINNGGAGRDVETAAKEVKRLVKDAYNIELEQEPRAFT